MKKLLLSICTIAISGHAAKAQWVSANSPSATGVHGLSVIDGKLFAATDNGVFYTTDGSTWTLSSTGMTFTSGFTFNKTLRRFGTDLYAGGFGKMFKSVDFGANWTEITGVAPGIVDHASYFVNGSNHLCSWAGSGGLRYSTNGGATWSGGSGLAHNSTLRDIVQVGSDLFVQTLAGICKSTDSGATWSTLSGGLPTYSGLSGSLNQSHGVLISSIYTAGVYVSADNGNTWTLKGAADGLTSNAGVGIYTGGDTVYLGCAGGKVFASNNDGTSWSEITGTGIPSFHVVECFAMYNGELYAGTNSGIYRRNMSGTGVQEESPALQCNVYPNPVIDQVMISMEDYQGSYTIAVVNAYGQTVAQYNQEGGPAAIDLGHLVPGIYHLTLTGNGQRGSATLVKQ